MLGRNVKIHFAGSDGSKENFCALVAADTHYRLYSCYNYIVGKSLTTISGCRKMILFWSSSGNRNTSFRIPAFSL